MPAIVNKFSLDGLSDDFLRLARRKGGGGRGSGGRGSSSHSSGSGTSSKSSSKQTLTSKQTVHFSGGSGLEGKVAKSYSKGGGPHVKLSGSPFKGREAGGGTRGGVYGTSRYGSGYPYGYGNSYYVSNYPLPYYYWPVPVQNRYYGSSTYAYNENERPGGVTVSVPIKSTISNTNDTYHLLGDTSSAQAVMDSLTRECNVASASPDWTFSNFDQPMKVKPEEVVQWYRASTFALSLDGYNNSAALISNMPKVESEAPLPLSADTPLPAWVNRTFLDCLNKTIGEALPLVDSSKPKFSGREIAGIVTGSLIGAIFLAVAVFFLVDYLINKKRRSRHFSLKALFKRKDKKVRGSYAAVDKAHKADHNDVLIQTKEPISYGNTQAGSDEKLIVRTSKLDVASSSTSPATSSAFSDDELYKPKFPFPEPKSTLDMEAKPTGHPAFPNLDTKHS